ncbi:hypothetical protein GLOIN_2v1473054 [Rhizophagus irregularis DAOM 181602=DAOM 197198]|uniref:Uncharacterized protein n=1 Tax=Rhizophagus irregularis (strain DAOM 197198w) TaxID=1432141 RepID=A0A015K1F7_RHIIW|nr:hypothetical protein RirG_245750 [Rhizophagus irregularis DAOM 197198w]GBC33052.2 hypothetical protein GLOIN_2v1473054 [Rhizophagus irregularis DAOM 181602=DAOM 197198]
MPSSNRTSTKKPLLPGNSHLYQERNKIVNELNSICDHMSIELGLETVVFTGSKLPCDSYAGRLGSKTGLNIAKELEWNELQTQVAVKAQNTQITCMPNTTIENPKKNKTLARAYVTKSLNELYIKAGGIGKIQFKNWENQKMEVVGWPEEIPFQKAGKQNKKNLDQIIDCILENKITFQSF